MVGHARVHLCPDHGDGVGVVRGDVDLCLDSCSGFIRVEDTKVDAEGIGMGDDDTLLIELGLFESCPKSS